MATTEERATYSRILVLFFALLLAVAVLWMAMSWGVEHDLIPDRWNRASKYAGVLPFIYLAFEGWALRKSEQG